jgi:Putative regulator of cell autolysis
MLTLGMREIYRRFLCKQRSFGQIVALMGSLCLAGGILQLGGFVLFHDAWPFEEEVLYAENSKFGVFYTRTGLLVCWSLLYFGIKLMRDADANKLRLALIESEKRNAQIQMLRAQINPHFLFNALNAIQSEIGRFSVSLKEGVKALAGYLRFSLDHTTDEFIPLGLEYDAMLDYFQVEKLRFGSEIELESHIDESARHAQVPGIILQPLVENAVKYGQRTTESPVQVKVRISRISANEVSISVANTGEWQGPAANRTGHIGLNNVRRRLELLYPGRHSLRIESRGGWVTVEIHLPDVHTMTNEASHPQSCAHRR